MNKVVNNFLFPLFIVNITTSANEWKILGFGIGQTLFWVIIGLSWFVARQTPYRRVSSIALALSLLLRGVEFFTESLLVHGLREGFMAILFVIAGATIYGVNPKLLHKQLIVFLALCIPLMLLQISGASSFFMGWNTEYANDSLILDIDEIGTFKKIPVYPTLFVGPENLFYQIGQGRPVGLLYSNNVLSVFVAISVGLNLVLARTSKLKYSDIIVTLSLVLTMSLMDYGITIILYLFFILFGSAWKKRLVFKLVSVLVLFIYFYYLFFPGLFFHAISQGKFLTSFFTRGIDLANSLGISLNNSFVYDQMQLLGSSFNIENTYSTFSALLKSSLAIPLSMGLLLLTFFYYRRIASIRHTPNSAYRIYAVTAIVCVLTQLAVPYIQAPSFQFILGLALFPLLKKLWPVHRMNHKMLND